MTLDIESMIAPSILHFRKLRFKAGELYLKNVLQCGQAFRWIFHEKLGQYSTTMRVDDRFSIIVVKQEQEDCIEYAAVGNNECRALGDFLARYFRLEVPLGSLYENEWLLRDSKFINKSPSGVRILSQDPWETLVSYICSSNNNISRITKMCHALCTEFGNLIGNYDGVDYYSFPTSNEIAQRASEEALRVLGFGYRAKYIIATARKMALERLQMSDSECLQSWRDHLQYEQVREKIMGFSGVGPKVADCVCLSGLEMDDVVPVDVHIARIALRDYKFNAKKQDVEELQVRYRELPITRKKVNYELDLIRSMFKERWGSYAGWAQGIVFAQEVGKTSGATSEGFTIKRKLEFDIKVEVDEEELSIKKKTFETVTAGPIIKKELSQATPFEEEVEYSITGRPRRKSTKNIGYEF
ncbi:LANO_0G13080g1_1 [Lachancea nothofagi CBS 11611]|uniref:DNA-(apurinic or apyrimidinic site) lyase n=1 Tax=Lachancea nothofagi CBS 11611 TaxID=1266666 RepID=A0A1G4KJY9_9SACH|nr:LANO_0G13080g1_1 [Lachancea nothofagi CBS 11611]